MTHSRLSLALSPFERVPLTVNGVEAYTVDRSMLQAVVVLEPLGPHEQACKDRCEERVRQAKADDSISLYEVRRRLFSMGRSA